MESKPVSFLDLLGLMLVGLKLAGVIEWSWWAVLCPMYIPLAVTFCSGLVIGFKKARKARQERQRT